MLKMLSAEQYDIVGRFTDKNAAIALRRKIRCLGFTPSEVLLLSTKSTIGLTNYVVFVLCRDRKKGVLNGKSKVAR